MGIKSKAIVLALRKTAEAINRSPQYQWGHMGKCNCGFLAQQVCGLTSMEIHRRAMERHGDWSEQLLDYCPSSGMLMDEVITCLLNFGFDLDELTNLERLSDSSVLRLLPMEQRYLRHNIKEDVVLYLNTWADWVEASLAADELMKATPSPSAAMAGNTRSNP